MMANTDPDKWRKVKEILFAALQRPPEERERFLDRSCEGDPDLRREVESLLLTSEAAGSFMQGEAVGEVAEVIVGNNNSLCTGQNFGHYKILKLVGQGGMGEVYLAEDTRLERMVALKILPSGFAQSSERMHRFLREAKAASALNHPNILTIHEAAEFEDTNYIASEFVDGETLSDRLRREPLNLGTALDIAVQITSALQAAHGAGIVHRDIKPDNVMIRPDGVVKILDFGIAKLTEKKKRTADAEAVTALASTTVPGMIIGTASYMSPEQARGLTVDQRSDIFSFGSVFYEMLAGQRAFAGDNPMDVIVSILHKEPVPLSQLMTDVPPEIKLIVNKTLMKEPAERYQTATELLSDLKDARQELEFHNKLGTQARTRISAPQIIGPAAKAYGLEYIVGGLKRHKLAAITALLALVVGVAALYYFTLVRGQNRQAGTEALNSIAVLPFVNAAQDPNAEYLSDGITESLINHLSSLSNLKVMSRGSVFPYKGKEQDPQKVGRDLNVSSVLTGSVKQIGDQFVINVSLDDARDNRHIWGEQYVRKLSDILVVQSDITQEVSTNLRLKLTGADEQHLAKRYTDNVEAYQLYLKGMYEWNKHTQEDLHKGIEYFEQALEKDPNYALAYCGLSASYGVLAADYLSPNEAFPKAKEYAAKALALDDTLAEAHSAMAAVRLYFDWDWGEAEKEVKRAQILNPNSPTAYHLYGDCLEIRGSFDEAIVARTRAQELDPLSPLYNWVEGATFYFERQNEEAVKQLERTIDMEPHFVPSYFWLGQAFEQKKMYERAISTYQKGLAQADGDPSLIAALGHAYAMSGERDKARRSLAELQTLSKRQYISPYFVALVYAGLGDKDQTFAWLDKAFNDRTPTLIWLKVEPLFDPMRDDPRFQDLLRRIGL